MSNSHPIPGADTDAWTLARGALDGRPSLMRFRPALEAFIGHPNYSRKLQVTWSYDDDGDSGMPPEQESAGMQGLEDKLVPALESVHAGTLAFVFTHAGAREWHFYVDPRADLGTLINEALADAPGLPIELQLEEDPHWATFSNVLDAVGASTAQ